MARVRVSLAPFVLLLSASAHAGECPRPAAIEDAIWCAKNETIVFKTVKPTPLIPGVPTPEPPAPYTGLIWDSTPLRKQPEPSAAPPSPPAAPPRVVTLPVPTPPPEKSLPPIIKLGRVPLGLVGIRALPPPEYDHHYEGRLIIRVVDSHAQLLDLCSSPGRRVSNDTLACARRLDFGDKCLVYMLREDLLRSYANRGWTVGIMLRHEIGHCNGWPGHHPDARPLPNGE